MKLMNRMKEAIDSRLLKVMLALSGTMIAVCPAWCDVNGGSALKNFLKTLFSVLMFAGIVLIIAGAASLIREQVPCTIT